MAAHIESGTMVSPEQYKSYNLDHLGLVAGMYIENINRLGKIFRAVKEVYRGKHKNYGLTWRLVAAIVNLRCIFRKDVYLNALVWLNNDSLKWPLDLCWDYHKNDTRL